MILPEDFRDFLKLLNANNAEYLLIGGYAVSYYGYIRATNDIDIWINTTDSNSERILKTIKDFGFASLNIKADEFLKKDQIIRMGQPPLRIELLTSISGVEFNDCYKNRKTIELDGIKINIISLKDLLINKKSTGRHKDLDDAENIS